MIYSDFGAIIVKYTYLIQLINVTALSFWNFSKWFFKFYIAKLRPKNKNAWLKFKLQKLKDKKGNKKNNFKNGDILILWTKEEKGIRVEKGSKVTII